MNSQNNICISFLMFSILLAMLCVISGALGYVVLKDEEIAELLKKALTGGLLLGGVFGVGHSVFQKYSMFKDDKDKDGRIKNQINKYILVPLFMLLPIFAALLGELLFMGSGTTATATGYKETVASVTIGEVLIVAAMCVLYFFYRFMRSELASNCSHGNDSYGSEERGTLVNKA